MLTNSMPTLSRTLQGQFPDALIRNLMQTLGNCNQPLSHRNSVTLLPNFGRNDRGMYNGQQWNTDIFRDLAPSGGTFVDSSFTYNGSPVSVLQGDNILLQSDINNTLSQTFGGPTFISQGDSVFTNTFHNDINTSNINTTTINNNPAGVPIRGPAGPPGQPGSPALGDPSGPVGLPGPGGFPTEGFRLVSLKVVIDVDESSVPVARPITTQSVGVITGISNDTIQVLEDYEVEGDDALTAASFNSEECDVDTTASTFVTSVSPTYTSVVESVSDTVENIQTISGTPGQVDVLRGVTPRYATILVLARG